MSIASEDLLRALVELADEAGREIMRHYATGIEVAEKADKSPVTAADEAGEAIILDGLARLTPAIPVVAEEAVAKGRIPAVGDGPFWLVDPLDGTKEFIQQRGEFTVNIGLVEDQLPVLGVVTAPAIDTAWWGAVGHGATRRKAGVVEKIAVRATPPAGGLVAVASRSHRDAETDAWLTAHGITETISCGSSLKFCAVAEGRADVYPRFGRTMEWDTAAGHAVLRAAGGEVVTTTGEPFRYTKPGFANDGGFIARAHGCRTTLPLLAELALATRLLRPVPAGLGVRLPGLELAHPLGLAAGFDKNAEALTGLARLGFAFIEAGTVTPRPQPGNPKPRLFRLARDQAIINRMGFNNAGLDAFTDQLATRPRDVVIGANIGINKEETDPRAAYAQGTERVLPLADYLSVNVSSPNTPGLRDLQERQALAGVLEAVTAARSRYVEAGGQRRPIFLKVAPDLDEAAALAIVDAAVAAAIDGLIVSNTTIARPADLVSPERHEAGGLSGRPLFAPSTRLLAVMARHAEGRLAFIGVGGIGSGADAYAKIRAGATALQLYTAFVYQGPRIIQRILDELSECLTRDGFADVEAAVGAGL